MKVTPLRMRHLLQAPYRLTWWGGKPFTRPFPGFNTGTHWSLIKGGLLTESHRDGRGTVTYDLTARGERAILEGTP